MNEIEKEREEVLVIALTRPPLKFGIPIQFFGLVFVCLGLLLVYTGPLYWPLIVPIHLFFYWLTSHDIHLGEILRARFWDCGVRRGWWSFGLSWFGVSRNFFFWNGGNSYSP